MKSLKKLIIPCVVLAVLIVALIIYSVVSKKNVTPETTEELNVYTAGIVDSVTVEKLLSKEPSVTVKNHIFSTGESKYEFYSEGSDSNLEYSQENLGLYVSMLSSFYANGHISSDGNYSEYGLDNPEFRITVNCMDGSSQVILIGDDTYDSSSCYFMLEGSKEIYSVTAMKKMYAEKKALDFLSTQVLNLDDSKLSSVVFDRKSDNISLKATCSYDSSTDSANYFIYEPFNIAGSEYFTNLLGYITTLEIQSFIEIPDDKLKDYGLDNPNYHFQLVLDSGETIELYLSEKLSGYYYGYIKGLDNYFMISEMQIKGLDTPVLTLINSYVAYKTVSTVSSYRVTHGDTTFTFATDVEEGQAIGAPKSVVTLDGRNAKISNSSDRTYCAVLFESLACIQIGGIDIKTLPATYDADMSISIVTKDYKTTTYDFVKRNDDSFYVYKDGKYTNFYVLSRELYFDGGIDTFDYGVWNAYQLLDKAITNNINGVYDIPEE